MPKLDGITITAWRYSSRYSRLGDSQSNFIDFMIRDGNGHQRHCYTRKGEALYDFLDARLQEIGYVEPQSEVNA